MSGVSPIEMIVEIALSLPAVMYNFHNHFCPAELLLYIFTFSLTFLHSLFQYAKMNHNKHTERTDLSMVVYIGLLLW